MSQPGDLTTMKGVGAMPTRGRLPDGALRRVAVALGILAFVELLLILLIARAGDPRFGLDLNLFVNAFLAIVAGFSVRGTIVGKGEWRVPVDVRLVLGEPHVIPRAAG